MAKKITIIIPDEIFNKLDAVREKNKTSMSQITAISIEYLTYSMDTNNEKTFTFENKDGEKIELKK